MVMTPSSTLLHAAGALAQLHLQEIHGLLSPNGMF